MLNGYGVQLDPSWYDLYAKYVGRMRVKKFWRQIMHSSATETTLNFSGPYRRIRPAKLTNHSAY